MKQPAILPRSRERETHAIKVVYSGDANDQSGSSSGYLIEQGGSNPFKSLHWSNHHSFRRANHLPPATMTANAMGLPPPTGTLYIQVGTA